MIKCKKLAMSVPAVANHTEAGYVVWCCCVVILCMAYCVGAALFRTPQEEQRSFPLISLLSIPQAASLSFRRPLRVITSPGYCGDTGKAGNHCIWESSSSWEGEGGNTHKVVPAGWHTLYCHNIYLFVVKHIPAH